MTYNLHKDSTRFHEEPVTKIWDRLYLGCYYDAEQLRKSNPHDITTVINLTHDPIDFGGSKIKHFMYSMDDGHPVDASVMFAVLHTIRDLLETGETVLVHCHAGMSRSVCMVGAYLYMTGFLPLDEAIQYVKEKRPVAQPHDKIYNSIKKHFRLFPYHGSFGKPVRD